MRLTEGRNSCPGLEFISCEDFQHHLCNLFARTNCQCYRRLLLKFQNVYFSFCPFIRIQFQQYGQLTPFCVRGCERLINRLERKQFQNVRADGVALNVSSICLYCSIKGQDTSRSIMDKMLAPEVRPVSSSLSEDRQLRKRSLTWTLVWLRNFSIV